MSIYDFNFQDSADDFTLFILLLIKFILIKQVLKINL
jgi:hypothetical protein